MQQLVELLQHDHDHPLSSALDDKGGHFNRSDPIHPHGTDRQAAQCGQDLNAVVISEPPLPAKLTPLHPPLSPGGLMEQGYARYSEAVKADVRRRMSPPQRQSVAQISAELVIHVVNPYSCRKAWRLQGEVVPASQKDPEG